MKKGYFKCFFFEKSLQVLTSISKKICPIRILLIKDGTLFWSQFVRVVSKQIEDRLFVKREQVLTFYIKIVHPIDLIGFLILIEIVLIHDCTFLLISLPHQKTYHATTVVLVPQGHCLEYAALG